MTDDSGGKVGFWCGGGLSCRSMDIASAGGVVLSRAIAGLMAISGNSTLSARFAAIEIEVIVTIVFPASFDGGGGALSLTSRTSMWFS